jgi:3-oxoacyl-[acyl-carrier protein] reductase
VTLTLQNKVALVTGAARGIGQAMAAALRTEGARVVAFDRSFVGETVDRQVVGSVAEEWDVLKLFESIQEREGQLDIVVNCAGIQVIRPLLETTLADFDAVVDVNLKGTFLVGREALRMMSRQLPGGRVINVASELAYIGRANYSAYCATKGAVVSLTRAWAREFAPHVLVNAVAPGPTETAMISLDCMTKEEIAAEVAGIPLGRLAQPREIAAAIVFLAGPGATYFTGQVIGPNGGTSMA